ncbi:BspA family leucine-rich repeat surface protein, partial [Mycoplasma yeatsii]|uniref:BspA family leucine-rich repeat surface protein n=1 Tax=Mycoplasma yeatsii TaxID=51365 RepID=UPI0006862444
SSILGIVKEVNNLKNNDQQSVLNRFIQLNSTRLNLHKITRNQLKVVVNDNVATITVINHPNYQGSIQINLKSSLKVTKSYLGVLDNDDQQSILRTLNNQNNWNFSLNDLNIEVNGKDAKITGKENKNKKFIGTINVEFGLKAKYTWSKKELTRIGFFRNSSGEWQIEEVNTLTSEVVPHLPRFITSLKFAFRGNLNTTISGLEKWVTSQVTNMSGMFKDAKYFNQNIDTEIFWPDRNSPTLFETGVWETSRVTDMSFMFDGAKNFNGNISSWNTSQVTNMSFMFREAEKFNQDISTKTFGNISIDTHHAWHTLSVTNMRFMFREARTFNQHIGNWDTSNVTDMESMFEMAESFNQPLNDWNTSKVTDMSWMFGNARNFNQPLNDWNVSSVTNMKRMFYKAEFFNQFLNNWNTSNVTDMEEMFLEATRFSSNISNWNLGKLRKYRHFAKGSAYEFYNWLGLRLLWPKKLYDNGNECF